MKGCTFHLVPAPTQKIDCKVENDDEAQVSSAEEGRRTAMAELNEPAEVGTDKRLRILKLKQQESRELRLLVRKLALESFENGPGSTRLGPLCDAVAHRLHLRGELLPCRHQSNINSMLYSSPNFPFPGFYEIEAKKPIEEYPGLVINVFKTVTDTPRNTPRDTLSSGGLPSPTTQNTPSTVFVGSFAPYKRFQRFLYQTAVVHSLIKVRRLPDCFKAQLLERNVECSSVRGRVVGAEELTALFVDVPRLLLQALYSSARIRSLVQEQFTALCCGENNRVSALDVTQFLLDLGSALLPSHDAGDNVALAEEDLKRMPHTTQEGVCFEDFYHTIFEYALLMHSRNAAVTEDTIVCFIRHLWAFLKEKGEIELSYREQLDAERREEMRQYKKGILVPYSEFSNRTVDAQIDMTRQVGRGAFSGLSATVQKIFGASLLNNINFNETEGKERQASIHPAPDAKEANKDAEESSGDDLDGLLGYLAADSEVSEESMHEQREEYHHRQNQLTQVYIPTRDEVEEEGPHPCAVLAPTSDPPELSKRGQLTQRRVAAMLQRSTTMTRKVVRYAENKTFQKRYRPSTALGASSGVLLSQRSARLKQDCSLDTQTYTTLVERASRFEEILSSVPLSNGEKVSFRNVVSSEEDLMHHIRDLQMDGYKEKASKQLLAYRSLLALPHRHMTALYNSLQRKRVVSRRKRCKRERTPAPKYTWSSEEEIEVGPRVRVVCEEEEVERVRPFTASRLKKSGALESLREGGGLEWLVLGLAEDGQRPHPPRSCRAVLNEITALPPAALQRMLASPQHSRHSAAIRSHKSTQDTAALSLIAVLALVSVSPFREMQ